ncbi:ABC transporter permease [Nesterenkonia sp. AN1]|uniref:ABC-type nitrate/sulfonate/bicarbonate transport system permease component n=1 Tax=Nesterenkonia aurantiaca TaxID=1436010 RepID=A0A4R7G7B0_9MICC|nr:MULTISPECIES: ABC transporter permease subunit [Nesterenkonia]EXF25671.1 ABC transporter permease [Nesterenkonia sp. AN1]TDS87350.1 ABC-type nitrate/sulfonate/bicarbonate transport system permease component [Nesterenkonia aurantiaca]
MNTEIDRRRAALYSLAGLGAVILLWWAAALTVLSEARVPSPAGVIQALIRDGFGFYWGHFSVTIQEAAIGFFWGNLIAILLASVVLVLPWTERLITQIAVISYCIPIVAVAPVLYIVIGAPATGEPSGTAVALAVLAVFFTTVVGTLLGLKSADPASLDVVTVYGGSRLTQLRKVRLIAALPAILNALQIAAPAALLGAILGEYVGGVRQGVGLALIIAQQNLDVERAWAIGLLCAAVAGGAYALFGLIGKVAAPWSKGTV